MVQLWDESRRWAARQSKRARVVTNVPALDALLGGGWQLGRVGELVGVASSGRTSVATVTVSAATVRGEVAAWIDPADAFDPSSAAAAGVLLERLLWVRPTGLEQAVRAAELILEVGGFTVVVVDLAESAVLSGRSTGRERERRGALRLRLARAVERANAVGLVLTERPWLAGLAGVTLRLGSGVPQWGGASAPRWLCALGVRGGLERGARVEGQTPGQPARDRWAVGA